MDAITINHLAFKFSDSEKLLLKDINFHLEYGKITLLAGQTGIGKSTLLSLITRLIPQEKSGEIRGDILLDGKSIAGMNITEISSKIAFVLQDIDSQLFHQYLDDEILFGMENIGIEKKEAFERKDEILKLLNVSPNRIVSTLSGGEKSLAMIYSMIAMGQKILILDEPFANLDLNKSLQLLHFLKGEAKKGKAILLCEHRTDLVEDFADQIVHIEDGVLKNGKGEYDTFTQEKANPGTLYKGENPLVLDVKNLSVSFDGRKVLDSVSLPIHRGERITILGLNGEGKTTLLDRISGLKKAKGARFNEYITGKNNIHSHRWFNAVGMVFQNPSYELFQSTVKKELQFHAFSKAYVMEIAKKFKLLPLLERHPQSLSEGEKRRLTLACAIAKKPEILFMDEPSVGQDKECILNMIQTLNQLVEQGLSIVTITHDRFIADSLSDTLYFLHDGKLSKISSSEAFVDFIKNSTKKVTP